MKLDRGHLVDHNVTNRYNSLSEDVWGRVENSMAVDSMKHVVVCYSSSFSIIVNGHC